MATPPRSSRDVITPEAFRVADHLVGTPLAKPSRRLGAILIDLFLVAILSTLGGAALVIALVGAILVFRFSRGGTGRWYYRVYRHGLGCFGAVLTFVALLFIGDSIRDLFSDDEAGDAPPSVTVDSAGNTTVDDLGLADALVLGTYGFRLRNAERPAQRDSIADELVEAAADAGFTSAQVRDVVAELATDEALSSAAADAIVAANERRAARLENRAPRSLEELRQADSLAASLAQTPDDSTAEPAALDGDSTLLAARDTIRVLRFELGETEDRLVRAEAGRDSMEARLERGAIRWYLSSLSDELGLGLGWLGLYFTAFTVLGRGQTPGKRVFRLRVIRLDGRSIGWWASLQRFGGYSASVFTGLAGFAEMLWDDNRQALQDKLVHTVVIQEPKPGAGSAGVATPETGASAAIEAAEAPDGSDAGDEPADLATSRGTPIETGDAAADDDAANSDGPPDLARNGDGREARPQHPDAPESDPPLPPDGERG